MEDEVGDAALPEEEGMGEEGGDDGQHESPGVDAANSGAEQNTAQHDGTPITFKPLHSHKRRTGITKPPVWVSCMVSAYPHPSLTYPHSHLATPTSTLPTAPPPTLPTHHLRVSCRGTQGWLVSCCWRPKAEQYVLAHR